MRIRDWSSDVCSSDLLQTYAIPSRVAFDVRNGSFRLAQRPSAAHPGRRVVHVGHILAYPVVQLGFQVIAFFPGADVLALYYLDVVRQTADHEDIRQLRTQLVEIGRATCRERVCEYV